MWPTEVKFPAARFFFPSPRPLFPSPRFFPFSSSPPPPPRDYTRRLHRLPGLRRLCPPPRPPAASACLPDLPPPPPASPTSRRLRPPSPASTRLPGLPPPPPASPTSRRLRPPPRPPAASSASRRLHPPPPASQSDGVVDWGLPNSRLPGAMVYGGVKTWLDGLGLSRYASVFEIHEVDDEVLPLLMLEDLKDMGIGAIGSRRKMYAAIQKL
ncbi:hypothetical protein GUJ93_ZPchr0013g34172 [Zizania palustris]|uniref:SAM domain-containing protein n=1 Tax=Zizania palustris TaxID=103762 RepID=A0A8J6C048_ZIZPA|nr:hypothetical protein GUJ93_ZPchr0013g34172 [Zizania palustris]